MKPQAVHIHVEEHTPLHDGTFLLLHINNILQTPPILKMLLTTFLTHEAPPPWLKKQTNDEKLGCDLWLTWKEDGSLYLP